MSSFDELYDLVMESEETFEDDSFMEAALEEMDYEDAMEFMEAMNEVPDGVKFNPYSRKIRKGVKHAIETGKNPDDFSTDETDNRCAKISAYLKDKKVIAAIAMTFATLASIGSGIAIYKHNKTIKAKIKKLESEASKIKSDHEKGKISDVDAVKQLTRINIEIKKLSREAKKLAKEEERAAKAKAKEKAVKESADDIRLAIYESAYEGDISEEERDILLDMLDE